MSFRLKLSKVIKIVKIQPSMEKVKSEILTDNNINYRDQSQI